jgi:hypothetical protein
MGGVNNNINNPFYGGMFNSLNENIYNKFNADEKQSFLNKYEGKHPSPFMIMAFDSQYKKANPIAQSSPIQNTTPTMNNVAPVNVPAPSSANQIGGLQAQGQTNLGMTPKPSITPQISPVINIPSKKISSAMQNEIPASAATANKITS